MKKITYILTILILSIIPLNSAEKKDCSDLNKFSKAFITCKANNLKIGITESVDKTGNNIKDYQKKAWSKKN
tara:strand:+ start:295 stop:510 length:216 start_codon:yes stop_codon:yes gene_type:complete